MPAPDMSRVLRRHLRPDPTHGDDRGPPERAARGADRRRTGRGQRRGDRYRPRPRRPARPRGDDTDPGDQHRQPRLAPVLPPPRPPGALPPPAWHGWGGRESGRWLLRATALDP